MPNKRFFRRQQIYYPDSNKFLKYWLDEKSRFTRERIMFCGPDGQQGVPMSLLLDKNKSELDGILKDAGANMKNLPRNGKVILIASVRS